MTVSEHPPVTVGSLAELVRAKNAGPFWMTLDVFFGNDTAYERVAQSRQLTAEVIAREYRVGASTVSIYRIPSIRAIKISFPRPVPQGSFADRDMHSGQQHILLSQLAVD
jgi:Domain of unknown function (DUF4387)